jgi:aquaporin Z
MNQNLRACLAEMAGVFFLTFIGAGAICTNAVTQPAGAVGLVGIAMAHGLALAIAVTATMNISGGHINPAVTVTMWTFKKIDTGKALAYLGFQFLGALIAGGLLTLIFGVTDAATTASLGTPHTDGLRLLGLEMGMQFWAVALVIETFLTFLLIFAVFGTAVDPRAPKVGGFAIGLTIAADILLGGPLTGAAMNPARAFGPAVWEAGIKQDYGVLRDQWVYFVGPILGGVLAGGFYLNFLMPEEHGRG